MIMPMVNQAVGIFLQGWWYDHSHLPSRSRNCTSETMNQTGRPQSSSLLLNVQKQQRQPHAQSMIQKSNNSCVQRHTNSCLHMGIPTGSCGESTHPQETRNDILRLVLSALGQLSSDEIGWWFADALRQFCALDTETTATIRWNLLRPHVVYTWWLHIGFTAFRMLQRPGDPKIDPFISMMDIWLLVLRQKLMALLKHGAPAPTPWSERRPLKCHEFLCRA